MARTIQVLMVLCGLSLVGGCASIQQNESVQSQYFVSEDVRGLKEELFYIAEQVLVLKGYEISSADEFSWTIITAPRTMRLDETYGNCGTQQGTRLIGDVKTLTSVTLELVIDDNRIRVKATIRGVYMKSAANAVDLTCVSSGRLEGEIIQAIRLQPREEPIGSAR